MKKKLILNHFVGFIVLSVFPCVQAGVITDTGVNVGIGATRPTARLHIGSTAAVTPTYNLYFS